MEVDGTNLATFKVHFIRELETRGQLNDSVLKFGEPVQLHYYYKQTTGKVPIIDKMKDDTVSNLLLEPITEAYIAEFEAE